MASQPSEIAERYRRVAGRFTERVRAVPADAWDNPSPCEGWDARDVVGHLVGWIPGFLGRWGIDVVVQTSVDDDPLAAWLECSAAIQAALDDPDTAAREADSPLGRQSLEQIVGMIVIGDVLVHTWDLARATGQDETLDPDEVARLNSAMGQVPDEVLRSGGQFGPRIDVADDADLQTKLLAFSGRRP